MNELQIDALSFQGRGPYTFCIKSGSITGLRGASGAGKTLLLRAIADLDTHSGDVRIGNTICSQTPAPLWRKTVAMLPAESFWWFDTVGEHFDHPGTIIFNYLELLGFDPDVLRWEVGRLSTGEKQRLAIIRLLQNDPRALLLDEPTASLDRDNIARVEELFLDYCGEHNVPVLWVSHDAQQLKRLADNELFLDTNGSLQQTQGVTNGR